ncbi:hypothetical protein NIES2101_07925 [Calothrix sp. HK-06]|nr:hypothetical protein NIES2101_07925 [Calothrix sp. HK-06]
MCLTTPYFACETISNGLWFTSMNLLDCTTLIKKLVLLTTLTMATSVSLSFDISAEAQLNPRPSIFKEYPYRRAQGRKVKRSSTSRSKTKPPNIKPKKQGTVANNRRRPFTKVEKKSPLQPLTIEFHAPRYPGSR